MSNGKLQTLDRGIEALLMVARSPEGLKVSDLASRLGLHRAVAYRIVATLADHDMIRRVGDGRIALGAGAFLLATHAADGIRSMARPVLENLAQATGATAFLAMAQGGECVVVLTAEPQDVAVAIHYRVGRRHPITQGAAGIAILSTRPETQMDSDDIRFARTHGYSVTRGQLHRGAVGVSSAVRLPGEGYRGQEFSIGVVALEELDIDRAAQAVVGAATALSQAIS